MAIPDKVKQATIRRASFEAHVRDCEVCACPDGDVAPNFMPCMSGRIMLGHYVAALKASASASKEG